MNSETPIRFSNRELAEKIASRNGDVVTTVSVQMVGREDVSKLLKKVREAKSVPPSSTFRVK